MRKKKSGKKETALVARSQAIEKSLFGSRANSHRGNAIQVREQVNSLRRDLHGARRREGVDAHTTGTRLARLFHAWADAIFEHETFLEFTQAEFGLGESSVRRYVRIAKYATEAQSGWGIDAVLHAASIVDLFASDVHLRDRHGLRGAPRRIKDIAKVELAVTGGKIRLADDPSDAQIEDALGRLKAVSSPGQRRLPVALRTRNDLLRKACANDPALDDVDARFVVRAKKKRFTLSVPEGANLQRIVQALERVLEEE